MIRQKRKSIKYPKFLTLFITFAVAYWIFAIAEFPGLDTLIINSGWIGAFLAGMMYTYSFTSGLATGIFVVMANNGHPIITGIIAGLGSLLGDLVIFQLIRSSFQDEIKLLSKEKIIILIRKMIPRKIKKWVAPTLGAAIIASPLPDELGVSLLATDKDISTKIFSVISYIFNTLGIIIILVLSYYF